MVIEKKFNSISEISALQRIASMADKEVYLAQSGGDHQGGRPVLHRPVRPGLFPAAQSHHGLPLCDPDGGAGPQKKCLCRRGLLSGRSGSSKNRWDVRSVGFAVFYRSLLVISGEISCSAFRVWQGSERHGRAEGKDLGYHICPDFFIGCSFIWGGLCPLPAFLDGGRRCSGAFGSCTCAV